MAKLSFRINAEWEKVQKLREEIAKLKQEIKGTDAIQAPHAFNVLNAKLVQTSQELGKVEGKIIAVSATMETDFKQKIFAASQGVNDFTEKIIAQKAVVKLQTDILKKLKDEYTGVGKNTYQSIAVRERLSSVNKILEEERHKLFLLTQEQAAARLSVKKLRDEYALFKQEGGGTAQTMDLLTSKMKGIAATVMGGMGLKELASRIISVRAEFESMETSLKVLLGGNQERLNSIMGQIKEYALASPLNTKDMVGAVQMMTSFGIEAEKSIDYLKAIGDISMGDTGKFNSLALAFSQMSSAGKLMGQDLMQMVNAGFNPLEEIARKTGKSIGQLKDEMSKGAISSKMVQDAFISATSAGGKFYGMSSEGAKTLNGQISMLQESFDNMFNEIGQKGESVVMGAVKAGTYLVENYQTIGKIVEGLVLTYGIYRTGVALNIVLEKAHAANMTVTGYTVDALKAKWASLNATALLNPYVIAAAALVAFGMTLHEVSKRVDTASAAIDRLNNANAEVSKSSEIEISKLNALRAQLEQNEKGTNKWKATKDAIIEQYGKYDSKLVAEIERTGTLTSSYENLTIAIRKSVAARQLKQFYDTNVQETQDDIQERRSSIYKGLSKVYGQQTTNLLMKYVNQYASTGKGLDTKLIYKGKKTTVRNMINNVHGDLFSMGGGTEARQMRELQLNSDKALADFVAMNGISEKEKNEILYGVKPADNKKNPTNPSITKKDLEEKRKSLQAQLDGLSEIEAKGKKGAELRKKINAISEREKIYSATNDTKSSSKAEKERKQRIKDAKAQQKANEDLAKQKIVQSEAELELENQVEQSRIDSLIDGNEKTIATMKLAHKKEMEQIEKQKQDYLKKKQDEAKTEFEADPKNKDKIFNMSSVTLSAAEQEKFDEMRANVKIKHAREDKEVEIARLQSLYDYLKEYGTVQQQMYAIAKEYDEKIAKEQDENRKKTLEAKKRNALARADANSIALDIDWSATFSGVGNVLKDIAKETLKEVEAYMKTAEFKALSPESKKAYSDLRNNLRKEGVGDATSPFNFGIWGKIADETKVYQDAVKTLKEKIKAHTKAVVDLNKAEKDLADATNETTKSIAQAKVDTARARVDKTGAEQTEAKTEADAAKQNLTDSTNAAAQGIHNFTSALNEMSNGSLYGFANGVTKLVTSLMKGSDGVSKGLSELGGKVGGIIGAILQIIDALGDAPAEFISSLLDKVGKAVQAIITELPNIIVDIIKGVVNIVGGIIEGIGSWFGADDWMSGSNAKEVKETTERLTKSNAALQGSIDELRESIDKSGGAKAIDSYEEAYKNQEAVNRNTMEILKAQMGYHDHHHSNAYYWSLGGKEYKEINDTLEKYKKDNPIAKTIIDSVRSLEDIYKLTPEQMKAISVNNVELWSRMLDEGKYDKSEYWEKYVALAGELEALTEKISDNLTQTSFDSLHDDFVSTIMDMDATASDFADDFTQMMARAYTNAAVGDLMDDDLKKFKEKWTGKMDKKNGKVDFTKDDIDELRSDYQTLTDKALSIRNAMQEATGYTGKDSQNASANGVSSITFEQANNIVALTTAGNISRDQIKDLLTAKLSTIDASIRGIQIMTEEQKSIADELRTIQANSYIELQGIHEDTTAMSKAMKTMSGDVADIKKAIKNM